MKKPTFFIRHWRSQSNLFITRYGAWWENNKKVNSTKNPLKNFTYTCPVKAKEFTWQNNGYLLPPWFQNGIAPSLFTRCGPLKLCLYWNLTWRSLGTEAKDKLVKNNTNITPYNTSTEAILKIEVRNSAHKAFWVSGLSRYLSNSDWFSLSLQKLSSTQAGFFKSLKRERGR